MSEPNRERDIKSITYELVDPYTQEAQTNLTAFVESEIEKMKSEMSSLDPSQNRERIQELQNHRLLFGQGSQTGKYILQDSNPQGFLVWAKEGRNPVGFCVVRIEENEKGKKVNGSFVGTSIYYTRLGIASQLTQIAYERAIQVGVTQGDVSLRMPSEKLLMKNGFELKPLGNGVFSVISKRD